MKEFTKEMLDTLNNGIKEVSGTEHYTKYYMECDRKANGRWQYLCWSYPHTTGVMKTVKGITHIITKDGYGNETRYRVNEDVKELLNI